LNKKKLRSNRWENIMGRLTDKDDCGNWCLKGVQWAKLHVNAVMDKGTSELLYGALCKLLRYEETGMDPNEVEKLKSSTRETEDLLTKLNEEQSRHRWISVDERLPDTEELVLIQISGRPAKHIRLYDALMMAEYDQNEGWCLEMYPEWSGAKPVAWMPLPEPYKKEPDYS
jgi:hypothetical protein